MTEYFETFDEAGKAAGLVARSIVHAQGLWHKSAHVLLFTPGGALYLQRRADHKDLCPGRWDLSVGEHLQPGESFAAGAERGLREELGITGVALTALSAVRRTTCRFPDRGIVDRELQQTFRGVYDGPVNFIDGEVAEVRRLDMATVADWVQREPELFTPWFLDELTFHDLLGNQPSQNRPS